MCAGEQWLRSYLLATYRVWGELTPGHWADLLHGLGRLQVGMALGTWGYGEYGQGSI